MNLDVATILAIGATIAAASGAFMFSSWLSHRESRALLWWAGANCASAAAMLAIGTRGTALDIVGIVVAPLAIVVAATLIWSAVRSFAGRPIPPLVLVAGPAIVILADLVPAVFASDFLRQTVAEAVSAALLVAAAAELATLRGEASRTRFYLLGLLAVQAGSGIIATLIGGRAFGYKPMAETDPFGGALFLIYLIFVCGSAIVLTALVRERSETGHRKAAEIDSLTGVASRRAFLDAARGVLARRPAGHERGRGLPPNTLLLFDLDRFKGVNDTYGHAVGDRVLELFGETVRRWLRRDDLAGRLGGEEFAVLLPGYSPEAGFAVAERIRVAFAEAARIVSQRPVAATVSAGVAATVSDAPSLEKLLEVADRALYGAKAKGRNRVQMAGAPDPGDANIIRIA